MEGEMESIQNEVPFQMMIQGAIEGQQFNIVGKGAGNAQTGNMKGKWVCTSGKLPLSWPALAGTLGYGFKCFAKFPNGLKHFFQECMPDGYTQERVTRFQSDGHLRTYHEVHFQNGVVMNRVLLQGDGFKTDSPVLNDGLDYLLPATETTFPFENGVKSLVHHIYPLKYSAGGGYLIATQTTVNRPLGEGRLVKQPTHHFIRSEVRQSKDPEDGDDHIIQDEAIEGYDFVLLKL